MRHRTSRQNRNWEGVTREKNRRVRKRKERSLKRNKKETVTNLLFFLSVDAAADAGCCAQRRENSNQPEPANRKRAEKVSALTKKINFVLEICEVAETTHTHQLKMNLDLLPRC